MSGTIITKKPEHWFTVYHRANGKTTKEDINKDSSDNLTYFFNNYKEKLSIEETYNAYGIICRETFEQNNTAKNMEFSLAGAFYGNLAFADFVLFIGTLDDYDVNLLKMVLMGCKLYNVPIYSIVYNDEGEPSDLKTVDLDNF